MKHIVESVEEMYHARQPTGEVIVDEVLDILRHYKLIYPEDVALLMDVKVRDLRSAWFMLTGTRLVDVITYWRVLQAQDWLRKRLGEISTERCEKGELVKLLIGSLICGNSVKNILHVYQSEFLRTCGEAEKQHHCCD